jgi:hypothetical protein
MTVFGDPLEVMIADPAHSEFEQHFQVLDVQTEGVWWWSSILSVGNEFESSALGKPRQERQESMNPTSNGENDEEMQEEYDFSHGVRGKHYEAYRAGTNVVFLDTDVAKVFRDSAAVNEALRLLMKLAQQTVHTP